MSVLELLAELDAENRLPSAEEQGVLARWSGWGSLPEVFDDTVDHAEPALRARELLAGRVRAAAARTTLNAHYTDAALVKAVWAALGEAGFDEAAGGRVLEPGCGSGTFIGFAPDHVRDVVGVELDPTTARVASLLYPAADIRAESFAETRLPEGKRDLVIGNVPFADVVPHDKTYNSERLSLHNYFIYKSLNLARPGGVVAVLTSRWTMDAANPAAREAFASMADLVSALRLPNQAHHRAAGTDVITDLLVFRRRAEGEEPLELMPSWRGLEPLPSFRAGPGVEDREVNLNALFVQQPARVLGRLTSRMGRFGPEVAVSPPLTTEGQSLAERVATDLQRQLTFDLTNYAGVRPLFTPRPVATRPTANPPARTPVARPGRSPQRRIEEEPLVLPDRVVRAEGNISMDEDGGWQHVRDGVPEPLKVPKSQANELRMLLGLRDTVVTLLEAEATTPLPGDLPTATAVPTGPGMAGEEQMAALRERLNRQYDAYVKRFGPINRVTSRNTGRFDPKTGEPVLAQVRPRQGGFGDDPHSPPVFALEHYDSATGTARKADIFTARVVAPRVIRTHADSPADAVSLCLDTYGELRTSEIARLLGVDQRQAADELEGFAFVDPDTVKRTEDGWTADWVPRAEFLSGNVRARLSGVGEVLEQLVDGAVAFGDESAQPMVRRLQAAAAALGEVLPEDLGPTEIVAQLGVPWVPAKTVEQFLSETLDDRTVEVEHPGGSVWSVRGNRHTVAARNTWGTERASAIDIVQACLEQRQIRITDETPDGRRIPNETATFAAQEKAEELQERFATWLWEDPERCQQLVRRYNDALNAIVLRSYDVAEDKHYPGMARVQDGRPLRLRPHQHAAVARMVAQPSVLLAHEVGAGKTLAAVSGVSELRRLGLVRKPAVVVPNHMVLLTAPPKALIRGPRRKWMQWTNYDRYCSTGAGNSRGLGAVRAGTTASLPFVVVDEHGEEVEPFSVFLRDLMLTDMSPLTARSYAQDLLRWWRLLHALGVDWDRASRADVEVLVGWMRSADNPQRHRSPSTSTSAPMSEGSVNHRTGKRALGSGYAPATINHTLSVLSSFYTFHAQFGRGPVANPVPASSTRRARLAHRSPLEPRPQHRRAPLRQKPPVLVPRSIPDDLAAELLATMRSTRDRVLLALFLSTGARASELLGVTGDRVDWTRQQLWVISKGTRALQPVPTSPEALRLLAAYFDERGTPAAEEVIWRTLRGQPRPLSYFAARRVLQRANDLLGTDWTLHDLRHTTIERMTADPNLTLEDVMTVARHQHVTSLDHYLRPRVEEVFDRLQQHYAAPRPATTPTPGYDDADFKTVFGAPSSVAESTGESDG